MADDEPMEEAPADAPAEGEVEVAEMSVLGRAAGRAQARPDPRRPEARLREVAKALDSRTAKLCCLAKDCDNAEYSNLVRRSATRAACRWSWSTRASSSGNGRASARINEEGEATSVELAACVTEFGEDTRAFRAADVPQGPGARAGESGSVQRSGGRARAEGG